jgi:ribonuclease Z
VPTFDTLIKIVLATLVQVPEWGHVLLDAGEGTWGQIARRFGVEATLSGDASPTESPADKVLRDIRCIFISHLHADHHIGLSKLLALRKKV